jgi:peptidoglycan/LPS O-acetylase OafA/YrhL
MARLLDRLSRITSAGKIIPEVEGLRFIAITTVILHHLGGQLLRKKGSQFEFNTMSSVISQLVWQSGSAAVQLFFTISAFILALRFAKQYRANGPKVSLKNYYVRRLTRLEPPYLIALVVTLPFAFLVAGGRGHILQLLQHLIASAVYLHGTIFGYPSSINGVSWSLEVEVQFYIIAPILGMVYKIRPTLIRYGIYLLFGALAILWQHLHPIDGLALFLPHHLQFFIGGFFLADIYVTEWNSDPKISRAFDLFSLVGWGLLIVLIYVQNQWTKLLPVVIIVAYIGALRGHWTTRILSNPYITTIGGMCYSLYLYHFTIIIVLSRLSFKLVRGNQFLPNFLVQIAVLGVIVLFSGSIFFYAFERPFMEKSWPQHLVRHRRGKPRQVNGEI